MKEEWRGIEGYEGLYQVSNKGVIRRLRYTGKNRDSDYIMPKILKQAITPKGYKSIFLCKDNKKKKYQVHRLVALAFIEVDIIRDQVNHKDGNKENNNITNLEWMTQSENIKHSYDNNFRKANCYWQGIKGKDNPNSKQVVVLDMNDNLINVFDSITQCRDWLRETINPKATDSHIVSCCKGNRNKHCGYKYKYGSDYYQ